MPRFRQFSSAVRCATRGVRVAVGGWVRGDGLVSLPDGPFELRNYCKTSYSYGGNNGNSRDEFVQGPVWRD
eukprot:3390083-Prymnesium_polylepis.1